MRKIYCDSRIEFKEVQEVLLLQGYRWQDSGRNIIQIYPSYINKAVISVNIIDKLMWYSDGAPRVFSSDIVSAKKYINHYISEKDEKVKRDIINWIDKEFDIEL